MKKAWGEYIYKTLVTTWILIGCILELLQCTDALQKTTVRISITLKLLVTFRKNGISSDRLTAQTREVKLCFLHNWWHSQDLQYFTEFQTGRKLFKMFIHIYLLMLHASVLVGLLQVEYTIDCSKLLHLTTIYFYPRLNNTHNARLIDNGRICQMYYK